MIEKLRVKNINLNITTGTAMYVLIDVFKFVKEEDAPWIDVYIQDKGEYKFLDEIQTNPIADEELKKEAIKWLFKKVSIE